jgi:hypothetical protein
MLLNTYVFQGYKHVHTHTRARARALKQSKAITRKRKFINLPCSLDPILSHLNTTICSYISMSDLFLQVYRQSLYSYIAFSKHATRLATPLQQTLFQRGFDYALLSKCEQLFTVCRKFDFTRYSKHFLVASAKYHCCLKSWRLFSFCVYICTTNLVWFIQDMYSVNIQLNCHFATFTPPLLSHLIACNPRSQSRLRFTV